MPIRRIFRRGVRVRAARDRRFRHALLEEGAEALLAGDVPAMRATLRTYVNATLGFAALARATGIPDKSLMRMLGPRGNPRTAHLALVLERLTEHEGVSLQVRAREPDDRLTRNPHGPG